MKLCLGFHKGLYLGLCYLNIFLYDLFFIMENIDIASYPHDNTPYTTGNSSEEVIQKLENAAKTHFQWFSENQTLTSVTLYYVA